MVLRGVPGKMVDLIPKLHIALACDEPGVFDGAVIPLEIGDHLPIGIGNERHGGVDRLAAIGLVRVDKPVKGSLVDLTGFGPEQEIGRQRPHEG